MTYCTPYLLSLGLSKSRTSLVWLAGPLSGLVAQPVIGVLADGSTSRWGRRRPVVMLGAVVGAVAMLVLGFTAEIVAFFAPSPPEEGGGGGWVVVGTAVLAIYVVDFAVNAVMSGAKSLIVDTLPIEKQQLGAAWASRMAAIGHVIGYAGGAVDLVGTLGDTFGDTQFKLLTLVAVVTILATTAITCWAVTEKVLLPPLESRGRGRSRSRDRSGSSSTSSSHRRKRSSRWVGFRVASEIFSAMADLPPRIQAICWAQFWSWIGWFPFLFYSTTWVGETYFRYDAPPPPPPSSSSGSTIVGSPPSSSSSGRSIAGGSSGGGSGGDALGDIGRVGSRVFFVSSVITLVASLALPLVVRSPGEEGRKTTAAARYTRRPHPTLEPVLRRLGGEGAAVPRPDLLTVWMGGEVLFAGAMLLAPFATSHRFATVLVCLCAVPWAIAGWAPSALLGVEVNRLAAAKQGARDHDVELSLLGGGREDAARGRAGGEAAELSGIYFGILNVYTTLPQFVGTFISAIVFALLEPGEKTGPDGEEEMPLRGGRGGGPNAISVCLFIGALSTLVAVGVTRRLRRLA